MSKEKNKWAISLIDKAGEKVGSFYKLEKLTGMHQSTISSIRSGKVRLPAKWIFELSQIAEVDGVEYQRQILMEQAPDTERGQRLRERLGKAAAAGAAAMLLFSYSNGSDFTMETIASEVNPLHIV